MKVVADREMVRQDAGASTVSPATTGWLVVAALLASGFGFPAVRSMFPAAGALLSTVTYAALSVLLYVAVTLRLARGLPRPHLAVILFLGFATMSLLWSSNPIESTVKLAGLVTALLLGAVFAASGTHVVQAVVIKAGAVGLTLSVLLVFALPHIGLSQDNRGDFWQGAFATKNVFGRISALCLVTAVVVALSRRASRPHRRMASAVALLAAVCLYFSGSVGAHISAAACAVVALALLPLRGRRGLAPRLAGVICVTTVVGLVYYAVLNPQKFAPLLGRDATLTGRRTIWRTAQLYADAEPWIGYGFGSFFAPDSATRISASRALGVDVPHAHNFFLDMRLDLGWLGVGLWLLLMAAVLAVASAALAETRLDLAAGVLLVRLRERRGREHQPERLVPGTPVRDGDHVAAS